MKLRVQLLGIAVACMFMGVAAPASAVAVKLDFNDTSAKSARTVATGASGSVKLSFFDAADGVKVRLKITNTTGRLPSGKFGAGATKSVLTGFGLDLPGGVSYAANSFSSSGGLSTLLRNASVTPLNARNIAFADDRSFMGGDAKKGSGLKAGQSTTIKFVLKSKKKPIDAASLAKRIRDSLASANPIHAVLRFQKVNAGTRNDKLIYVGKKLSPKPVAVQTPTPVNNPPAATPPVFTPPVFTTPGLGTPSGEIEVADASTNGQSLDDGRSTPPVPLPATLPLLFAAIAGLAFVGRHRFA